MDVLLLLALLPGCLCAVTVTVPPKVEVAFGHEAIFTCQPKFSGSPKYSVEWSYVDQDGQRTRIATFNDGKASVDPDTPFSGRAAMRSDNSLVISDIRVKDESEFVCRVNTVSEGTGEGSAQLKVFVTPSAPELLVNTHSVSITEQIAAEVGTCTSRNSYPAPAIEWYKNHVLMDAGTEKTGDLYVSSRMTVEASGLYTVSSTLFLKPTKADADAVFSCKAVFPLPGDSKSNMESKEFKLPLHYYTENVKLTVSPEVPLKEGDKVTLHCEGDGNPAPTYLFQKQKAGGAVDDLDSGSDGFYIFQNISREDSGTYICEALDFDSPDEILLKKQIDLNVHYLNPLTLIPSGEVHHSVGDNVPLNCIGDGSEIPTLVWKKGDKILSSSNRHRLRNLTYADSGVYTCEATVSTVPGLVKEASVTVVVEGPPDLGPESESVDVPSEGHMLTLSCSATGYPEPAIRWNPAELQPTQTVSGKIVKSEVAFKVTSKLINDISCTATNSLGTKDKKFKLSISSLVPPSTAPAQEQSGSSSTAIIAVVVCVLLLLLVVGLFFILQKKGKLACGRSEKQPLSQDPASAELAVELKSEKRNEQRGLLGSRGGGGGGPAAEC
ncbi:basal cell adhesion molecule [Hyla sarda]|uniref:basal cell adhesion molecule n=1 Tax=Hyla sarda TaxID=327740 RepID=UPI0024C23463|nr:basal cell adhesion molecule [Hyla sarda]